MATVLELPPAGLKDDELLSPEQAAHVLGIKRQTLAMWRSTGKYQIPFIKVGRNMIRYSRRQLEAWIAQNTMTSTGGTPVED